MIRDRLSRTGCPQQPTTTCKFWGNPPYHPLLPVDPSPTLTNSSRGGNLNVRCGNVAESDCRSFWNVPLIVHMKIPFNSFEKSTIIPVGGIHLACSADCKRFSFIPCHFHTRKRMHKHVTARTNKGAVGTYLENKLVAQRELKRLRAKASEDPDQKSGSNAPDES